MRDNGRHAPLAPPRCAGLRPRRRHRGTRRGLRRLREPRSAHHDARAGAAADLLRPADAAAAAARDAGDGRRHPSGHRGPPGGCRGLRRAVHRPRRLEPDQRRAGPRDLRRERPPDRRRLPRRRGDRHLRHRLHPGRAADPEPGRDRPHRPCQPVPGLHRADRAGGARPLRPVGAAELRPHRAPLEPSAGRRHRAGPGPRRQAARGGLRGPAGPGAAGPRGRRGRRRSRHQRRHPPARRRAHRRRPGTARTGPCGGRSRASTPTPSSSSGTWTTHRPSSGAPARPCSGTLPATCG